MSQQATTTSNSRNPVHPTQPDPEVTPRAKWRQLLRRTELVGNVQEWTNTPYDSSSSRYVDGGSFDSNAAHWNCISAGWLSPELDQNQQKNGEVGKTEDEKLRERTGFRVLIPKL